MELYPTNLSYFASAPMMGGRRSLNYSGLTKEQIAVLNQDLEDAGTRVSEQYDLSDRNLDWRAVERDAKMEFDEVAKKADAYRKENGVATEKDDSASESSTTTSRAFGSVTSRAKKITFESPINGDRMMKAQALTQQRVFERELGTIRKELSKKDISDEQYADLVYKQEVYKNGIAGLKTLMSNQSVADNADALQALDDKIEDAKSAVSEMFNLKYGENMTTGAQSVSDFIAKEDFSFITKNKKGEVVHLASKLNTAQELKAEEDKQAAKKLEANKKILQRIKELKESVDNLDNEEKCVNAYKELKDLIAKAENADIMQKGGIVLGDASLTKNELEKIKNNIFRQQLKVADYDRKRDWHKKGAGMGDKYNWGKLKNSFSNRHNNDNGKLTDALAFLKDYEAVVNDACDWSNDVEFIKDWHKTIVEGLRAHGYKLEGIEFDNNASYEGELASQMKKLKEAVEKATGLDF